MDKTMRKLYRVTTNTFDTTKTVSTWAESENEIIETLTRLAPFTTIESIEEVTSETLKIR